LRNNSFLPSGFESIVKGLIANPKSALSHLNLAVNPIGQWATSFSCSTFCVVLIGCVWFNSGDASAAAISMLFRSPSLKVLDLGRCLLWGRSNTGGSSVITTSTAPIPAASTGAASAAAVSADAVPTSPKATTDQSWLEALRLNTSLCNLSVVGNYFHADFNLQLMAIFQHHSSLLDLKTSAYGEVDSANLMKAYRHARIHRFTKFLLDSVCLNLPLVLNRLIAEYLYEFSNLPLSI
jgi:hypothetical protein